MSVDRKKPERITIVGGGVIGAACARELAQRGRGVTVVDAGAVGGACSFGNAGLISLGHAPIPRPGVVMQALRWMFDSESPLYIAPRLDPALVAWLWRFRAACTPEAFRKNMKALCDLCIGSRDLFDRIAAEAPEPFFYRNEGYYEVFMTEEHLESAHQIAAAAEPHGFEHNVIDGATLIAREPALSPGLVGAIEWPRSAIADPYAFTRSLVAQAERFGADFRENAPVRALEVEGGRVRGITLDSGERVSADAVILAAGVWSATLARPLRLHLPLQPARGYHRDIPLPDPPLTTGCVFGEANMVATPMGDRLRLAGTLEFSGFTDKMRRNRLEMLAAGARRYLATANGSLDAAPMSEWAGPRPCLPDGLPAIGPSRKARGLHVATGHAMLGLSHAPTTAQRLADLMLGGETDIDMAPFDPDRFSRR